MGYPKKVIYTLNINNYMPELCKITIPTIQAYADRIGATFIIITERKFPKWPITYEKMQLFKLTKDNEWSFFIDADTIIGPHLKDLTELIPTHKIGIHMAYDANKHLPNDYYMIKDRRNIGVVTNFMLVHQTMHKIWTPLEENVQKALHRLRTVDASNHIVDEYCISRNMARYGISHIGIIPFCKKQFLHLSATVENNNVLIKARAFLEKCKIN
jgi:hypothetical protein